MPWWSWLVIWGALIVALLGLFAWQGIRLLRKVTRTMRELSALADKAADLQRHAEVLAEAHFEPAVLADAGKLSRARAEERARRATARQVHRDARLQQARLLTKAEPQKFPQPTKRI